ncbi:bifunctional riboflavin kinase/FAD synthetase [Kiloniella laminariae]|uniref:bifunctional riboflavin kinase/FAD synthetase n=1 Tax=Kiloniella laminariae TaxID=454162 RepID=UPI00036962AD|nr:bifunctional riboflavin kinase/FAD synthetase [Kiloniella laminariae]
MAVFHNFSNLPAEARGAVVAIGNFDGVHLGHQAVIGQAAEIAKKLGLPLAVLTFEPHPRSLFQPNQPCFRLTPMIAKAHALHKAGVDHVFVQDFTREFSQQSAEVFVLDTLVRDLGAKQLVIGWDFCFGKNRQGNAQLLEKMGAEHGFSVHAAKAVTDHSDVALSSSRVRDYLQQGKPVAAAKILGRYWEIDGPVLHGFQRGRTIGFPTANLSMDNYLVPALGVYAVRIAKAGVEGLGRTHWYHGVANIGTRPTLDGDSVNLEVFIFDFDEDIYGMDLRVQIVDYLRPEKKFDGLTALKEQIDKDSKQARELLMSLRDHPLEFVVPTASIE